MERERIKRLLNRYLDNAEKFIREIEKIRRRHGLNREQMTMAVALLEALKEDG